MHAIIRQGNGKYYISLILKDGYVYFVDEELEVEEITDEYCWFKARHMKYHIIPD